MVMNLASVLCWSHYSSSETILRIFKLSSWQHIEHVIEMVVLNWIFFFSFLLSFALWLFSSDNLPVTWRQANENQVILVFLKNISYYTAVKIK